jgi:predicted RNA methylase
MEAYERAINQVVQRGDHVLDLGAGTGILGFLALKAGAERVYAIEKSDSIELAREVAHRNGFLERIEFFKESSLDVILTRKADVLVSETLGSFGIDENTLEFIADAKKRLLKPAARLLPRGMNLFLSPVEAPDTFRKLSFWQEVSGLDFSPALETFSKKMLVEDLPDSGLLSTPMKFSGIDFHTDFDVIQDGVLRFVMQRAATIHGFAGWFELELSEGVKLSTAPGKEKTHWKQAFFPAWPSVQVVRGDVLDLSLEVTPQDPGSDNTTISYNYRCTQLANEWQEMKVGRNDPCPCGSSRKFKKCCG